MGTQGPAACDENARWRASVLPRGSRAATRFAGSAPPHRSFHGGHVARMVIKQQAMAPSVSTRDDVREVLIELWSQVFEAELRSELEAEAEANGERARLRAIERASISSR